MTPTTSKLGGQAIVIGASMGGMLAARALADYFETVTLLERDAIPPAGENRKGVPQGRHTHALLARGLVILEQLFPGIEATLLEQRAVLRDLGQFVRWFNAGGYHARYQSGLMGLGVSRPRLEATVRAKLLEISNVRLMENSAVSGLSANAQRDRVVGVRVSRKDQVGDETLAADLVVDATGRGSQAPAWLEALGYQRPAEEQIRVDIGYATRYYQMPANTTEIDAIALATNPPGTRGGVLIRQEDNRFVVTLFGYFGDHPTARVDEFDAFAASLPRPEIYQMMKRCVPLTDVEVFKYPANNRRYYERLDRFPAGLLVFGDAMCTFNPIYAQGMTARATEALALSDCLHSSLERLALRYFKAAGRVIDIPWSIAVGNDLRYPQANGERTPVIRFINWYIGKLHVAAWNDPVVALAFLKVVNLMAPPPAVMVPPVMLRVLLGNLRSRRPAPG